MRITVESASGFTVVGEATSGREAVEAVSLHQPEVILIDASMPEMDGLQAIPLIRRASETTKILMLSGLTASYMEATARDLGADGYVEKGTSGRELVAAISALFR